MIGFGRYNLLFKLAQGGMGVLYLARQKTLKRFCALKVIHPHLSGEKGCAERFLNEAQAAAALSHPNLVNIFDCDQFDGKYFIAMEFIEGMSLGDIIRSCGNLPISIALCWLNQAALALQYIHGRNIVHRDIKPDNMMIDAEGVLKVTDLGLAKNCFEGDQNMTSTGAVMGSPFYMSPEQINDSKAVDHRTDLYSLGIVLYQMLVGEVPFRQSSAAAVMMAHLNNPMPSISASRPDITQPIDQLIARLTAKNRVERIQSTTDLLVELQPWLSENPLDEGAQLVWSRLDFKSRKVEAILKANPINPTQMDSDLHGKSEPSRLQYLKGSFVFLLTLLTLLTLLIAIGWFLFRPAPPKQPPLNQQTAVSPADIRQSPPTLPTNRPPITQQPASPPTPPVPQDNAPAKLPPPKMGGLLVKTQPKEATVMFQAKAKPSPATFEEIPSGKYSVKISLGGYREIEQEVEITEGKFTELSLTLAKIPGALLIASEPSGADLFVEDKWVGRTPFKVKGGDQENVKCRLQLDGYRDKIITVALSENSATRTEKLERQQKSVATIEAKSREWGWDGETGEYRKKATNRKGEGFLHDFEVSGVSTFGKSPTAIINQQIIEVGKIYTFRSGGRSIEYTVIRIEMDKVVFRHGDKDEILPVSGATMDSFKED